MDYIDFSTYEQVGALPLVLPERGKVIELSHRLYVSDGEKWVDISDMAYADMTPKQRKDLLNVARIKATGGGIHE